MEMDVSEFELEVFTDEDGMPWAAFVWGNINVKIVEAMITPEAIDNAIGFESADQRGDDISWPPRVQAYWLRLVTSDAFEDQDMWQFCDEGDPGAVRITGHRFYPK